MAEKTADLKHLEEKNLDRVLENMFLVMMVIHKKILKVDPIAFPGKITRLHMAVMGELGQSSMTMSELAKTLMLPKPQLTHIVEPLVKVGILDRCTDEKDRRVINLVLTEKGRVMLIEGKRKIKEHTRSRLATLTPEELSEMSSSLETLRSIVSKL
jgi:DNA-binding MarR family transcriptional regulator